MKHGEKNTLESILKAARTMVKRSSAEPDPNTGMAEHEYEHAEKETGADNRKPDLPPKPPSGQAPFESVQQTDERLWTESRFSAPGAQEDADGKTGPDVKTGMHYRAGSDAKTDGFGKTRADVKTDSLDRTAADVKTDSLNRTAADVKTNSLDRTAVDVKTNSLNRTAADVKTNSLNRTAADVKTNSLNRTAADVKTNSLDRAAADVKTNSLDRAAADVKTNSLDRAVADVKIDRLDKTLAEVNADSLDKAFANVKTDSPDKTHADVKTDNLVKTCADVKTDKHDRTGANIKTDRLDGTGANIKTDRLDGTGADDKADMYDTSNTVTEIDTETISAPEEYMTDIHTVGIHFLEFAVAFLTLSKCQYHSSSLKVSSLPFFTLVALDNWAEKDYTMSELAEKLRITKQQLSKMINMLEEKGLVERIHDRENRRRVYIRICDAGREMMDCLKQEMLESTLFGLRSYSPEELFEMDSCICRLIKLMEKFNTDPVHEDDRIEAGGGE